MPTKGGLWVEFVLLWLGLPAAVAAARFAAEHFSVELPILPLLWIVTVVCAVALWRDPTFDRRELGNIEGLRQCRRGIVWRFAVLGPLIFAVAWWTTPGTFVAFPKNHPWFWAAALVGYPVFSVYAQGLVWRSYVQHRYRALSDSPHLRWLMAAVAFGWLHVIFLNWQAPVLTLVGGYLFARTHERSRSLIASSVEHALYGCCMFTAGWGGYFYHGSSPFINDLLRG